MRYKVVIGKKNNTFPIKGLNELLSGKVYNYRTKKYQNPVKADNDKICRIAIHKYMNGLKITKPIRCHFHVFVKDKKHDRGNIYTATEKSFLDALQQEKVIKNDGYDDVLDSTFLTELDRLNPRIEVEVEEID